MFHVLAVFVGLWIVSYVVHLVYYFGLGTIIVRVNERFPERRIQQGRSGDPRHLVEKKQSLKTLLVNSGCLSGGIVCQLYGFTLWPAMDSSWTLMVAMLLLSLVLYDAWFYWTHRLLHLPRFYKHHFLHHRSHAPTPWSYSSGTALDAFSSQVYFLIIPMLLPVHPFVLIFHRGWDHINSQIGHAGFEYFAGRAARAPWPFLCIMFHDQHHEHYRYNYGNFFSIWDRLCGTLHPQYDQHVASTAARAKAENATLLDPDQGMLEPLAIRTHDATAGPRLPARFR